jgi:hypothetical protein
MGGENGTTASDMGHNFFDGFTAMETTMSFHGYVH